MGGKKEGLQRLMKDPPDLLVTSLELGDGTAPELLRELKEKMGTIPSIFIADSGPIEPQKKIGAFDLLQRPIETLELVQKINRAVNVTRQFRKKTRAESFVEYGKVHLESVSRGLTVSEFLELNKPA